MTFQKPEIGQSGWGTVLNSTLDWIKAQLTSLTTSLGGKSDVGHNHDEDYAPLEHTHDISDVTDLTAALGGKSDEGHDHDNRYYTETEVDGFLGGKVDDDDSRLSDAREPTAHTHDVDDIDATGSASSSTFLRGDGAWATPESAGDALPGFAVWDSAEEEWPARPSNDRVFFLSTDDPDATEPTDGELGDVWFRHPDAAPLGA